MLRQKSDSSISIWKYLDFQHRKKYVARERVLDLNTYESIAILNRPGIKLTIVNTGT